MIQERSREIQIKAILGRFNGDRQEAAAYCLRTAQQYPQLWNEYMTYKQIIEWESELRVAAYAGEN